LEAILGSGGLNQELNKLLSYPFLATKLQFSRRGLVIPIAMAIGANCDLSPVALAKGELPMDWGARNPTLFCPVFNGFPLNCRSQTVVYKVPMKNLNTPGSNHSGRPTQKMLKRLVKAITSAARPKRIILFGSAARGEMNEHSDLDVLIIVRNGVHRNRTCDRIYRKLFGIGFAKDIVVVTEDDVNRYGANPYMVIHTALKEGLELYHAA
jgi:predicted nucleotidyltransferase